MGAVMQAVEGPVQWTTLSVVDATMWAGSTFIALLFILKGNVTQHRNWMTRSYAIAIVFLGGRFFGGLTKMDQPGHDAMLLAIIWTCLALSVPIADVGIHLQELKRKRVVARAAAA
jgi:uncharacterized membrane protein YozB (DUF420 family)